MSVVAGPSLFDLPPRPPAVWGTVASVAMHAAVLVVLALLGVTATPLEPPVLQSVAVELISAAQYAALLPPPPTLAVPETPVPVPDVPAAEPPPSDGAIRATEFFSSGILTDPANAALARGMPTMADGERAVQLCNIEAVEQIRRAAPEYDPDVVVAYAFAETVVRDGALVAEGAAFRSRREWYRLRFSCMPAADFSGVTAFEFTLGAFVPHEDWDAHYLTADEVGD